MFEEVEIRNLRRFLGLFPLLCNSSGQALEPSLMLGSISEPTLAVENLVLRVAGWTSQDIMTWTWVGGAWGSRSKSQSVD